MKNSWLIRAHRYLAFIFSIPLFLMALSGLFISLSSWFLTTSPPGSERSMPELMLEVKRKMPEAELLRALTKGPGGEVSHLLLSTPKSSRVMVWAGETGLLEKDMRQDFVYQNKHFHEGFLLQTPGKLIVSFCGLGLLLLVLSGLAFSIKNNRLKSCCHQWLKFSFSLRNFHIVLGGVLALPLGFQAISGSMIEWQNYLFADVAMEKHVPPVQCSFEQQLKVIESLYASTVKFSPGVVYFCKKNFPYLVARFPDGVRQYTPEGQLVSQTSAQNWQGHGLTRKSFFVGLHEAKIFGEAHGFYNFFIAVFLLFFLVSGFIMWQKK